MSVHIMLKKRQSELSDVSHVSQINESQLQQVSHMQSDTHTLVWLDKHPWNCSTVCSDLIGEF